MPDKIYSIRLEPGFQQTIEDLRKAWGPVVGLTASDVIREALRRAHRSEAKKIRKNILGRG